VEHHEQPEPVCDAGQGGESEHRLFTVPKKIADTPQTNVDSSWKECTPENLATFSAVAYYFGRDLNKALDVPVGLIHTSWGGTVAEAWTSQAGPRSERRSEGVDEQCRLPRTPSPTISSNWTPT
jgi:hypothetical protein